MTKKDFELIAATIDSAEEITGRSDEQRAWAEHFARALAHTNPQFDRSRFLRACGVEA